MTNIISIIFILFSYKSMDSEDINIKHLCALKQTSKLL